MAYDVLQETTPGQAGKEYLEILKLAAEEGETPVDEALRELLTRKADAAIDRLVHHSAIIELNIPSYRVEQAGQMLALFASLGVRRFDLTRSDVDGYQRGYRAA